jgi:hypothetical protein
VDFHEDGFRSQLNGVDAQGEGFWFELDGGQQALLSARQLL